MVPQSERFVLMLKTKLSPISSPLHSGSFRCKSSTWKTSSRFLLWSHLKRKCWGGFPYINWRHLVEEESTWNNDVHVVIGTKHCFIELWCLKNGGGGGFQTRGQKNNPFRESEVTPRYFNKIEVLTLSSPLSSIWGIQSEVDLMCFESLS